MAINSRELPFPEPSIGVSDGCYCTHIAWLLGIQTQGFMLVMLAQ